MRTDNDCVSTAARAEEKEELREDGLPQGGVGPRIGHNLLSIERRVKR